MVADLKIGPVRPSTENVDYGPDVTATPKQQEPPKASQKNPPRPAGTVFGKLGQNKKVRSPVRKLTREASNPDELSDFERLENWYHTVGNFAQPFHPKFSQAMHNQAHDCAMAWFDLAENNDSVRRWVLAFIEGGAWGKVIGAHTPIFMAVIPESVLERFFLDVIGAFGKNVQPNEDENLTVPPFWTAEPQ